VLQEAHFARPPEWRLKLVANPSTWWDQVFAEIDTALEAGERPKERGAARLN